jgi:hypothetical protein
MWRKPIKKGVFYGVNQVLGIFLGSMKFDGISGSVEWWDMLPQMQC